MNNEKSRIQKILSQFGICSRRKAEELIKQKRVTINGKIAKIGDSCFLNDQIFVDDQLIKRDPKIYILLNKPQNIICTVNDDLKRKTIVDLINIKEYIYPIGRLDYNTTGVILLTNDGYLTNKLLHPSNEIKRVYNATLDNKLNEKELLFLNSTNVFIDEKISIQIVKWIDNSSYNIILHEGKNHHVKKIFKLVNKNVIALDRVEFANLRVAKLLQGQYRNIDEDEIKMLYDL